VSQSPAQAYFGRRYSLSAGHRLHTESLTAAQNRQAYGKCNNPYGHGHNYVVEVLVGGPVNPQTGMVVDLAGLDALVGAKILARFDHTNLNADPAFAEQVPTTENLCRTIFALLKDELPAGRLESVRIEETENNYFECCGELSRPAPEDDGEDK
jgi:6-pyruvoyltetrahydropterin/6-carboxytetrahydropterin synthase